MNQLAADEHGLNTDKSISCIYPCSSVFHPWQKRRSIMQRESVDRRDFLQQASASAAGLVLAGSLVGAEDKPLAVLGGQPVRTKRFPGWPVVQKNDRDAWLRVLDQGHWCRLDGKYADQFEKVYAELTGTKHCVAIANGTSALQASLNALDIGPGDEVIVPPYT